MDINIQAQTVSLQGHCSIEDVEELHRVLRDIDQPSFDLSHSLSLHTGIVQLIMVSTGKVRGPLADPLLEACFHAQITT